ncbi:MAG: Fur family transcriptional regulator [Nannocystaceae bacterium]
MSITTEEGRALLREHGLRVTPPRLAVLRVLDAADAPLSHTEALEILGDTDWDPATIYRNLIKLRDAGLALVVSRAGGIDRYALASSRHQAAHQHPHFVCDDCGKIACLPAELTSSMSVEGRWSASVRSAMVQLRGECPECLETHAQRG